MHSKEKNKETVKRLARVGYDNAIGYLKGEFEAWEKEGGVYRYYRKYWWKLPNYWWSHLATDGNHLTTDENHLNTDGNHLTCFKDNSPWLVVLF